MATSRGALSVADELFGGLDKGLQRMDILNTQEGDLAFRLQRLADINADAKERRFMERQQLRLAESAESRARKGQATAEGAALRAEGREKKKLASDLETAELNRSVLKTDQDRKKEVFELEKAAADLNLKTAKFEFEGAEKGRQVMTEFTEFLDKSNDFTPAQANLFKFVLHNPNNDIPAQLISRALGGNSAYADAAKEIIRATFLEKDFDTGAYTLREDIDTEAMNQALDILDREAEVRGITPPFGSKGRVVGPKGPGKEVTVGGFTFELTGDAAMDSSMVELAKDGVDPNDF